MQFSSDIQAWLATAGRYPLLDAKQEIMLAKTYQRGLEPDATPGQIRASKRAKDRLVNCNLRLVVAVGKRFHKRLSRSVLVDHSDMLQEGVIGLIRAVEKFDPTSGYKFSTYGYWWIRQAMGRLIDVELPIRLPANLPPLMRRLSYAPPDVKTKRQVMDYLEIDEKAYQRLQLALASQFPVSLDATHQRNEDSTTTPLSEQLADPASEPNLDALDRELAIAALEASGLHQELELLTLKVSGESLDSLANQTNLSRTVVSNRLQAAKARLRPYVEGFREGLAA